MAKNLVIVHLESVSQSAMWQFMEELPSLWGLCNRSAYFTRFYTTSTSSVMSMCDMMHGDSSMLDHNPRFPRNKTSLAKRSTNLFRTLFEHGYMTKGLQYGSFCVGDAPNNFWGVWPDECGQFEWHDTIDAFHEETRDFITRAKIENKPFALYFWNMSPHIRNDAEGDADAPFHERFQNGYRLLDESVKQLLRYLEDLDLMRDTIILAYGDHGDDFWRHGFNKGRTHVIEPYSNLCWTPMFLYNNDERKGTYDDLVASVDIKSTLLHLLLPEPPPKERLDEFVGIDILEQRRDGVFSQSMFALQIEFSDPAKAITKSYALTDGDVRLVVSSGGGDLEGRGGMELFIEQWDYGNNRNLLDFFNLDGNGNIVAFTKSHIVHPHFTKTFTKQRVISLVRSFNTMKHSLAGLIRMKETAALQYLTGDEKQLFPTDALRIRRKKQW